MTSFILPMPGTIGSAKIIFTSTNLVSESEQNILDKDENTPKSVDET